MKSRERFLKTIKGEKTDRMPVTMFIIDQGHFISQLYPYVDPHDFTALQLKVVEAQKQFGADVFVRMLYGINDPIHIHMGGVIVTQQSENWEVKTTETKNGTVTVQHSVIKTPDGQLTQDFSINEIRPGTFLYACTKKPILCEKDLDIAIRYEPKMPDDFVKKTKKRFKVIKEAVGEDGIVGAWAPHGPFNNASILIPHDDIYCIFLEDYAYYEKVMNFAMERVLGYMRAMEQSGVDVLCVGGNVPGGFLGKAIYDKYILPFEKKYIDLCQENGTL
jgi:uroporphyrinogen-III decarboxylase